jgi:hypothetical protein
MKTVDEIIELFPGCIDRRYGHFSHPYYNNIVSKFGEILISADAGEYQGSSYYIFKNDNKYGYLSFGWGSCSGCDALEACDSYQEITELFNSLESSIV